MKASRGYGKNRLIVNKICGCGWEMENVMTKIKICDMMRVDFNNNIRNEYFMRKNITRL